MSVRKGEDQRTPGVLSELQNVGADSKGLSPFLAFWRSATTPPTDSPKQTAPKPRAWLVVDVSPRRRVKHRRPILDTLFSALKTLAIQPAFGVDPVRAHDYWLPEDVAPQLRPTDTAQVESVEQAIVRPEAAAPRRARHARRRPNRSRRMVEATRRDT
jgi:hypothetical protein